MSQPLRDALPSSVDKLTEAAWVHCGLANRDEANAVIAEMLILAQTWAAGLVDLYHVRRNSTPQERFLAARFGPRPMPPYLLRLFDALVDADVTAQDGLLYRTPHGLMPRQEMPGELTKIERDEHGATRIRFASFWPWLLKPDPKAGSPEDRAGRRGAAVFAADQKQRAVFAAHVTYQPPGTERRDPWDL